MKKRYDAIVVGAGYGGVTCAAVLASRGRAVLVIDKNRRPGGKAMRVARAGTVSDLWPISGGPAAASRFHDLARLLGADPADLLAPNPGAEFLYLAPGARRRSMRVPARALWNPLEILGMLRDLGVGPAGVPPILKATAAALLASERALDALDGVSMKSWIDSFGLPPVYADLLLNLQNLFYVAATDQLPASEGIRTLREIARGGAGRYHRGGYGRLAEQAVAFVAARGGAWLPGARVEAIRTRGGRVTGVTTAEGAFTAPVVVSNAGLQPTVLKLAAGAKFPAGYVDYVRALKPSWAFVGVRYELTAPVVQVPMTIAYSPESAWDEARFARAEAGAWPRDPLLLVTVPSLYDPALASARTPQVVLAGVMASPDPASPMGRAAVAKVDEMVFRLWPGFRSRVRRRQVFGARQVSRAARDAVVPGQGGECIGLAQVVGQCGRSKPDARSPLAGLYYVGCDAGGRGIGTTQAVDSGFNVAGLVLADTPGEN